MAWNDNLTGNHLDIAANPATPLRVLAGPGTGKTFALMRRISRLLESGADPSRILVSTFTRTAAKDLASELAKLGIAGIEHVRAGTLHALSFAILSRVEVLATTGREPRPMMDFEVRFLVADLCHLLDIKSKACKKNLKAFNAAWARLQVDTPGWLATPADQAFDAALREWLTFHKAMLIGELVPECRKYLRNNPLCPERQNFDHVLVDEYQDLNKAEQEMLDLLALNGSLTVIGDENQSIYSFKHAHPDGIVDFHVAHPNTTNKDLTVCQRCPRLMVEMSNSLLAAGDGNARQMQVAPGKPNGEAHIVQWPSIEAEANGIADMIKRRIDAGQVEVGKVLVLAQRRQFGYAIRDALEARGVAAHSFFSEQELDGNAKNEGSYDAQEAFTLLALLAKPDDLVALRVWCGFGNDQLRSKAWERTRRHAVATGLTMRDCLNQLAAGTVAIAHTAGLVDRYRLLLQREQQCAGKLGAQLVDELFPAGAPWTEPLRTLAASIPSADFPSVELLETLREGIVQPEMPTEAEFVRIMSLHKSKGLTADFVAVLGLIEGVVPGAPDDELDHQAQAAKWEEDRRVFYVAMTRAKKTLILSSVMRMSLADAMQMRVKGQRIGANFRTTASRFLNDLGPTAPMPIAGTQLPQ